MIYIAGSYSHQSIQSMNHVTFLTWRPSCPVVSTSHLILAPANSTPSRVSFAHSQRSRSARSAALRRWRWRRSLLNTVQDNPFRVSASKDFATFFPSSFIKCVYVPYSTVKLVLYCTTAQIPSSLMIPWKCSNKAPNIMLMCHVSHSVWQYLHCFRLFLDARMCRQIFR